MIEEKGAPTADGLTNVLDMDLERYSGRSAPGFGRRSVSVNVGKFDRLAVCLLGRKDTVRTIHDPTSLGEEVGGVAGGGFADGTD